MDEILTTIDTKLQRKSKKNLIFIFSDNLDTSKLCNLASLRVLAEVFYIHQTPINANMHRYFTGLVSRNNRRDLDKLSELINGGSDFCFQRREFVKTKFRLEKPFDLKSKTNIEVRFIKQNRNPISQLKLMIIENEQFKGSIHDIILDRDDMKVIIPIEAKDDGTPAQFLRYVILSTDVQTIYDEGQLEFRASDMLGSIKDPIIEVKIGVISGSGNPNGIFDTIFTLLDEVNCVSNRSGRMSHISIPTTEIQIFQTSNNTKLYCLHLENENMKEEAKELIQKVDCLLVDLPYYCAHHVGSYIQEMASQKGIPFHMTLRNTYSHNKNNSKLINYSFADWDCLNEQPFQVFENGIKLSLLIKPLIGTVISRRASSFICDTSSITCIIQLHDFITNKQNDQFYHLDSMLKNRFRSSNIPFSLRMNSLPFLTPTVSSNEDILDIWYDVVISYNFNSIIVSGTGNIQVFDYTTKKHLKRIEMKGIGVHELEIDKSGLNLYLSGIWVNGIDLLPSGQQTRRVAKYDLQKLLFNDEGSEKSRLWISDDHLLTNLWGIGLFEFKNETFVYTMDYSKGLTALDSKTGKKVNHIMPIISCAYGVTFTPENEMIITSAADYNGSPVSVYTFNQELKKWELRKNGPVATGSNLTHGLFYEISTQRIFVTDTVSHAVKGYDLQTLEKVFHHQFTNESDQFYGILIDNKTGIMYIPEVNRKLLCFD